MGIILFVQELFFIFKKRFSFFLKLRNQRLRNRENSRTTSNLAHKGGSVLKTLVFALNHRINYALLLFLNLTR